MVRALAERNKRRVNLTPKKINARAFNRGNTVHVYIILPGMPGLQIG